MKSLIVLTGAGISAESGIKTFRDAGGLWEGHDVMEVASPQGWQKNPELVLDFYNQRRRQLHQVSPNRGHQILADLEADFEVHVITQNVDNLHERAGSTNVLHLHGELLKVRSTRDHQYILSWEGDLLAEHKDPKGHPLRPHIVWFGEDVPLLYDAAVMAGKADVFLVVGTSLQVYPAAGLVAYTQPQVPVIYVDPNPAPLHGLPNPITVIAEPASTGMEKVKKMLREM